MICYINKGKYIEKYNLEYNVEELKKLRNEVIENCSEIFHKVQVCSDLTKFDDKTKYRNLTKKYIGIYSTMEANEGEKQYRCEYDEYSYPFLVSLIDELLECNFSNISKIYEAKNDANYYIEEREKLIKEIKEINEKIGEGDEILYQLKQEKIRKLKHILNHLKLNSHRKSTYNYYLELQRIVYLVLINTISAEKVKEVNEFFEFDAEIPNEYIGKSTYNARLKLTL